tara:strand:- start:112 stop:432 length:321 start_codon:yes stop_codon:yes gene_type:complete
MKKLLFLMFLCNNVFAQITATHFNAGWNEANNVAWFMDLDCKTKGLTDIARNADEAKKHKIAVVPTIIIFKDGEEALRFQADLSFKMVATKEEVMEAIDELLMSDF